MKTADQIFMKVLPVVCLRIRKIPLNLGSNPHPDLHLRIFEGFFNIARWGIFQQFGSYLWKTDWIFNL